MDGWKSWSPLFACESITHQRQNNSIVTLYWGDFNINLLLRPQHNMPLFHPFAAVTLHLRFHSVRNYLLIEQHQRRHLDILPHINRRSRSIVQINSSWHFVATTTPQRPLTLIYYGGISSTTWGLLQMKFHLTLRAVWIMRNYAVKKFSKVKGIDLVIPFLLLYQKHCP